VDLVNTVRRRALERAIARHAPWTTRFDFDGIPSGGDYDAAHDPRLIEFRQAFPHARRVLDLGALEAGHAIALAAAQPGTRVTAVEGRPEHVRRACFAVDVLQRPEVTVFEADLDRVPPSALGRHDAALCLAIVHHLERPWLLVDNLPRAAAGAFIWTHVAPDRDAASDLDGVPGRWQRERPRDLLGGLGYRSFLPTLDGLVKRLRDAGYGHVDATEHEHVHGPAVTIVAVAL
jgi:xanthine/CO dehydrogenase XdhC/CoxF family maturation factor